MVVYCSSFLPSTRLEPILVSYIQEHCNHKSEVIAKYAEMCKSVRTHVKMIGHSRCPPSFIEYDSIQQQKPLIVKIFFPQGYSPTAKAMSIKAATTALEVTKAMMTKLETANISMYGVYRVTPNTERNFFFFFLFLSFLLSFFPSFLLFFKIKNKLK